MSDYDYLFRDPGCECVGAAETLMLVLDGQPEPKPCPVHRPEDHRAFVAAEKLAEAEADRDRRREVLEDAKAESEPTNVLPIDPRHEIGIGDDASFVSILEGIVGVGHVNSTEHPNQPYDAA